MTSCAPRNALLFLAIAFVAAACGSAVSSPGWTYGPTVASAPSGAAVPAASGGGSPAPSATVVRIAAKNTAFDQSQLIAPANTPFRIVFANQDTGISHNVAIYTDASAATALFTGAILPGPGERTYNVPALQAGSYFYRCDVHPTQMSGPLVVQ